MTDILIYGGTIINRGRSFKGYIRTKGELIAEVGEGEFKGSFSGSKIDATGKIVMPGVIDDQVHFREPGLTHKADIASESAAGIAGGVTSYMEMPNTNPATTSFEELEKKIERASEVSLANYSFYFGATNDNLSEIKKLNPKDICGVKLFMGSSTGNMLVDDDYTLSAIFAECPTIIATHCEDEATIRRNAEWFRKEYGENVSPDMHPLIRSAEACYRSSARAVELADKYDSRLHVLHLSTERELSLFDNRPLAKKRITNEVCVHHLWFTDADYAKKGNFIKWNPAIKSLADRDALREGLLNGKVDVVATDHAPHTLEEKLKPYWSCPSGGPLLQHSLVAMLELSRQGVLGVEQVVEKMCHAPAVRFGIVERGFLEKDKFADIVVVDPTSEWEVSKDNIRYKCGWSPFEQNIFHNKVLTTIVNGSIIFNNDEIIEKKVGKKLEFK